MDKNFNPTAIEEKWYSYWMEHKFFNSKPDEREPYTIVIPPPNVTGVLHMGHMLNNTIQDVLVRKARMEQKNACWVPGTDHASIATEAKVVNKLREEGVKKSDLSRDDFMKHAWDWTHKHGGIILDQLKRLGASCDWDRTNFTMDDHYYESVIQTFIELHKEGYIYRGQRMVNWDPKALTALSDEEVIHKEVQSKLYYIKYKIAGKDEFLTIATTRPETILGDSAISVHPEDKRFKHLVGKKAIVPLINREIPIIADDYIDMEFGTGCLKVTPAHDVNDYEIGQRHDLEIIDVLNANGTMSEAAELYVGEDRFVVRSKIAEQLEHEGFLEKVEEYTNKVGYSERTDVVIEPRLSLQWFCKMKELAQPALEVVMNDEVQFFPAKFKNTYKHWMENIKDWCISRQLWWGHRIPAYFYGEGENDYVIANSMEEAIQLAREKSGNDRLTAENLEQDEDVLDTWFSSWLWPMAVFDGIRNPENEEYNYYYPTNDLVTAPEIMFFWVARMIMAGKKYNGNIPFKHVYYTGIVRDPQGRKMSKSLGNSPDPIKLMGQYGADGVRVGMLFSSPAGNDLLFDVALCEQGRNFSNKIWNALRLVKSWEAENKAQPDYAHSAIQWFDARLSEAIEEVENHFSTFRISDALMSIYKLVWDDFCSWYLEIVKPPYGENIDEKTLQATLGYFEKLVKLLHPFMPFLTEEIWHLIREREEKECILVAQWPAAGSRDEQVLKQFSHVQEVISGVRNVRKDKNIPMKETLELIVSDTSYDLAPELEAVVLKMANVSDIQKADEKVEQAFSFIVGTMQYNIPFGDNIDTEAEIEKLQKELKYTQGFLTSVQKKLANERFVQNAPEKVIEGERKKESDAMSKIKSIEEKLAMFQGA